MSFYDSMVQDSTLNLTKVGFNSRENLSNIEISSFLVGDSWVSGAVVNLLSNNETSSGPFSGGTYNGSNFRFNNKSQSIAANQLCSLIILC